MPIDVLLHAVMLRRPLTGIGHYTLRLGMGLERHPGIGRVLYFHRFAWSSKRPRQARPAPWMGKAKNQARQIPLAGDLYHGLRRFAFRLASRRAGADVYHEPNYLLMPFDGPIVATIHDLSYLHYPQFHPKDRIRLMEKGMPHTLRRADHLITDSEHVRQELVRLLGVPADRVTAIALGVSAAFRPLSPEECGPVLDRYGLKGLPYLLALGTLEPRKNISGLISAYCRLSEKIQHEHPLVLAGMRGWLTDSVERQIEPLKRRGRLRVLGYVPSDDLPFLYGGAHAFAFPSFYEGFGLTPLEAMACGVPTLISDRSCLPEIAGDAALQVDPEDVEALTAGLDRLLFDPVFRDHARKTGPKRAAEFTWEKCVDRTVAVYRRVMGS